jgi:putative membrane protein
MNSFRCSTALAVCAFVWMTGARAGQSSPPSSSTDPAAAASPHQQDAMRGNRSHQAMAADHDGADPATFVARAAQGGMAEVALSKAAATKASDPGVKKFAAQMVQDHEKANNELSSIAKKKGLNVPASLDADHEALVQKISNQSGSVFDQAYGRQMARDHAQTVALFESAAQSTDSDLAAFAKNTLPKLKEHKQMAAKLPGAGRAAGIGESAKAAEAKAAEAKEAEKM